MANQVDLDRLFNRDFDSYKKETSTQFDLLMEKKIKRRKWLYYLKWTLGIAIIGGLLIASMVFINKDGQAGQTHQNPSELIELNNTLKTTEIELINSEDIEGSIPIRNTQSGVIEESFINEPPPGNLEETMIPIQKNSFAEHKETHTNDRSIKNTRSLVFEEILVKTESISIDYQVQREALVTKSYSVLPSIPLKAEKPKKQKRQKEKAKKKKVKSNVMVATETKKAKKKKRNKKVKEVDITIASSIESKDSYQKSKPRRQKISNQKVQNNASSALVLKPIKPKKEKKPSDFSGSIEFGFAPIYFKNMAVAYEPENDTVTVFITNKKPKASYDFGLEFLFKPTDGDWSIKTGLHYQQLNEEIDYYFQREYVDEELSHWQYDSIFEYHIDPPIHDTILVGVDSSYYEHLVLEENQKKHINQYTYLSIPLLIGYQIDLPSNRFKVNVLAGVNMSILLQSQGYYYDTDGYILSYPNNQKALINWALSAQVSVCYEWKKMSLYAKPSLQFQMKEKALDDYFERRQYVIYGLEFGINFKLF